MYMVCTLLMLPMFALLSVCCKSAGKSAPNAIMGYRTKRAKASQEAWTFGNDLCSEMAKKYAIAYLTFSVIIFGILFFINKKNPVSSHITYIPTILWIIFIVLLIYKVEKALKINFDDKGERKFS